MPRDKILLFFGCVGLLGGCLTPGLADNKNSFLKSGVLKDIVLGQSLNSLEIRILFTPDASLHVFHVPNPNRVVIDLQGIQVIKARRYIEVDGFGLSAIRVGQFKPDIARVVLDAQNQLPIYQMDRTQEGLKIILSKPAEPLLLQEEVRQEKKPEEKPETRAEAAATKEAREKAEEKAGAAGEKGLKTEELQRSQDAQLGFQNQGAGEGFGPQASKQILRVEATGNYFQPAEGIFRDTYEGGLMLGAEIDYRLLKFVELWAAVNHFSKRVALADSQESRKINLIPLEVGLKLRAYLGIVNPYLGAGLGYYQYREEYSSQVIKKQEVGMVGQAGLFVKFGGFFVFDLFAHYRQCRIKPLKEAFEIGGLHLGLGIGFEY